MVYLVNLKNYLVSGAHPWHVGLVREESKTGIMGWIKHLGGLLRSTTFCGATLINPGTESIAFKVCALQATILLVLFDKFAALASNASIAFPFVKFVLAKVYILLCRQIFFFQINVLFKIWIQRKIYIYK